MTTMKHTELLARCDWDPEEFERCCVAQNLSVVSPTEERLATHILRDEPDDDEDGEITKEDIAKLPVLG